MTLNIDRQFATPSRPSGKTPAGAPPEAVGGGGGGVVGTTEQPRLAIFSGMPAFHSDSDCATIQALRQSPKEGSHLKEES